MDHITKLIDLITQMPIDEVGLTEQDRADVLATLRDESKSQAEVLATAKGFLARLQQALTTWQNNKQAQADAEFDAAVGEAEQELQKTLTTAEESTQKLIDDAVTSLGTAPLS